jgi:hypothetical protein
MVLGQVVWVGRRGLLERGVADLQDVPDAPVAVIVFGHEAGERVVGEHVADRGVDVADVDSSLENRAERRPRLR